MKCGPLGYSISSSSLLVEDQMGMPHSSPVAWGLKHTVCQGLESEVSTQYYSMLTDQTRSLNCDLYKNLHP